MIPLHEQYRPSTWSEVIGQRKAIARIDALRARGLGGRAYWISGRSGTGKTTIARLLAAEVADKWWVQEMDADALSADWLREIETEIRYFGGGHKGGRAYIINEAHGLRATIVRRLLVLLEPLPPLPEHVVFIFTTTKLGEKKLFEDNIDAPPLLSRCTKLVLTNQGLSEPFAGRARTVAESEGLNGRPLAAYVKLCQECHNNMREVYQRIEAGEMAGAQ